MIIAIIQQYWDDHIWERYLINLSIIYVKVNEIQKLTKECRDWDVTSWLVLTVMHQCLEFRTQEQQKSAQIHSSDWIWAVSEYQNFWNQNFQLVSDTDLYDHSDLSAVIKHLLSCFKSFSCVSFISQQCLKSDSFML